jgi:hypothetical protein
MTTLREAAQQALEALGKWSSGQDVDAVALNDLIFTLESALAQEEQEPLAWMDAWMDDSGHPKHRLHIQSATEKRLYGPLRPLYTAPPQRKPLTDEEIDKLPWGPHESNPVTFAEGLRDFARAIERAHGIGGQDD